MVILLWSRRSPRKAKLKSNKLIFRHIYTRVSPITFESYRMCVEVKDELQAKEVTRHSGHRPTKKMRARGNYQQLKLETRVNMKSPSAECARSRLRDITLTYYSNISVTNVYLMSISFRSASRGEKKNHHTLSLTIWKTKTHKKKTYRIIIVAAFFTRRRRQHRDEPGRRTKRASHISQKFNTQGCENEAKKKQ